MIKATRTNCEGFVYAVPNQAFCVIMVCEKNEYPTMTMDTLRDDYRCIACIQARDCLGIERVIQQYAEGKKVWKFPERIPMYPTAFIKQLFRDIPDFTCSEILTDKESKSDRPTNYEECKCDDRVIKASDFFGIERVYISD